ncbi:unnamed protein product, partial [Vitis vinifera]
MLHIAVELGEARMGFVEKLVEFVPREALALRDSDGATALFKAARAGNIKAAKLLVNKNPSLPNICSVLVKLNHFLSQPNRGGMKNQVGSYELSTQMCCWTQLFKACQKANAIFWELVGWLGKEHNKTTTKACKSLEFNVMLSLI